MIKNRLYLVTGLIISILIMITCRKTEDLIEQDENLLLNSTLKSSQSTDGLISWWSGNNNANDIVGGHDGTLLNGATYVTGIVKQAFSFDGVDDYVSVPNSNEWNFRNDPFTITLWAKFNGLPNRAPFVDHNEGAGGTNKWVFWYDVWGHRPPSGPGLRFHINSPTLGALDAVTYLWQPNIGEWYHLAITRSESNYSLYIDGNKVITETETNTIPDANVPLSIGQSEFQYFFNGLIDEVEIFDRALTNNEIAKIFSIGGSLKHKKITICHKPCTPAQKSLEIPIQALTGHLNHGDYIGKCSVCCVPTTGAEYVISGGPDIATGIDVDDIIRVFVNGNLVADVFMTPLPLPSIHFVANTGDILRVQAQDANECYHLKALWLQKADGSCITQLTGDISGPNCGFEPPEQIFFDQTFSLP